MTLEKKKFLPIIFSYLTLQNEKNENVTYNTHECFDNIRKAYEILHKRN